jgi:hypothetical protein
MLGITDTAFDRQFMVTVLGAPSVYHAVTVAPTDGKPEMINAVTDLDLFQQTFRM